MLFLTLKGAVYIELRQQLWGAFHKMLTSCSEKPWFSIYCSKYECLICTLVHKEHSDIKFLKQKSNLKRQGILN